MPSATSLQSFSPRALEPFQIENTLAPLATGGSAAEAQTMLDTYGLQRMGAEDQYGREVDQQHQQALANLQQQMYDTNVKALTEAGKVPGMLEMFASSPQYNQMFGGANPLAIQNAADFASRLAKAKMLQESGAGINSISQAGFNPTGVAGDAGITNLGPYAGPALVQAAQIRLQGDLAKAAARKAGDGSITSSETYTDPGTQTPQTVHYGKGVTDQQKDAYRRAHGIPIVDQAPRNQNLPPAQRDEGTAASAPRTQTNLPANPPSASTSTSNTQTGVRDIQQQVQRDMHNYPAAVQADIRAGAVKNGGVPQVVPDGKGGYAVKGDKGSYPW
jgi:hypothetical protein